MSGPEISIVVPVFNSEACLPELARRVRSTMEGRFSRYELTLVDDCSTDGSWEAIVGVTREHPFATGVALRKNVGQDNAIMAGLKTAGGEVVIVMDDDLQHDPADIPALVDELRRGFDVVFARFPHKRQAVWKNIGSLLADRLAGWVLGKPSGIYLSPFKAIRGDVVREIIRYDGPYSYIDGLLFAVTSSTSQVRAEHHTRFAGRSNYTLRRSIQVALKLATSFSVLPLRIVTFLGGAISLAALLAAAFFAVQAFVLAQMPEGWPSLIVTVLFLGGIQLMGIGAVGEYIGRIFVTQNKRPQFTVREVVGRASPPEWSREVEAVEPVAAVPRSST